MKQLIFIICSAVLFAVLTESAGPGCAWSGCGEFKAYADLLHGTCKSGMAAGSGRTMRMKGQKCGFLNLGGKDYCCDSDCKYEACGDSCEELGKSSWEHEIEAKDCRFHNGIKWMRSKQEFCCP